MAWTTPATVAVDDTFPASRWNTEVRDNLNHLRETASRPLWIPAQDLGPGTNVTHANLNADAGNAVRFASFAAAGTGWAWGNIILPDAWISSGLTVKLWWASSGTNTGNAQFVFHAKGLVAGDGLGDAAGFIGPTVAAAPGVANQIVVTTIGTTSAPPAGSVIRFAVERRKDASDTLSDNVRLLGVELEFT